MVKNHPFLEPDHTWEIGQKLGGGRLFKDVFCRTMVHISMRWPCLYSSILNGSKMVVQLAH